MSETKKIKYISLMDKPINFKLQAKTLPSKGNMAWEYNPFHNYRLTSNKYYYRNKFYSLSELEQLFGITIGGKFETSDEIKLGYFKRSRENIGYSSNKNWYNCTVEGPSVNEFFTVKLEGIHKFDGESEPYLYEAGQLVDFETNELNFDLSNPVDIIPQYSYDNSVNLILNDGKNPPRLINSRFSAIGKNKYEIVDRKGDNDTNIYDQGDQFNIDTSLYKRTINIPKLEFEGVFSGGNLGVGNYHFYFKYIDSDSNETDFVAESGLVSIFMGNTPESINSGFGNQNSGKLVKFTLSNIDSAYKYVKVYYTKETSGYNQESQTTCYKIDQNFIIDQNNSCSVTISGFIKDLDISPDEINVQYNLVSAAETQAVCKNMLFLGNITKPNIPYEELADLSLRFLPYRNTKDYNAQLTPSYMIQGSNDGYYDPKFIYEFTGYWNNELYRLGIVYILPDNSLSPVFNIRGGYQIGSESETNYTEIDTFDPEKNRIYINISEDNYQIAGSQTYKEQQKSGNVVLENSKGVISLKTFSENDNNKFKIYSILIKTEQDVIDELKKYTKGFFFVRQKRMPTTLCQMLTIGKDKYSKTPVIPVGPKDSLFTNQLKSCKYSQVKDKIEVTGFMRTKVTKAEVLQSAEQALEENTNYYISESFLNGNNRTLGGDFLYRAKPIHKNYVDNTIAICPEAELDSSYYQNLFVGDDFTLEKSDMQPKNRYFSWNSSEERHFYVNQQDYESNKDLLYNSKSKIIYIPDGSKLMGIGNNTFLGIVGNAVDGWNYKYIAYENKITEANNLIRGIWGPFLGISDQGDSLLQYDVKIPGYSSSKIPEYYKIRYNDNSPYYAISDRIDINNINLNDNKLINLFRGDCYICQFTHRINRNFQDPTTPNNDMLVDNKCWANNYRVENGVTDKSKFAKINIGDINAVGLGTWVTFTLRSTKNLCIRAVDESHVDEKSLVGHGRGFYPYFPQHVTGSYKIPESQVYNKGFQKELGQKLNIEQADVPYIKNEFSNRIVYSNPYVSDSFINNFRVFELDHFKDYSKEYGSITKLVEQNGSLLCVFEHGIAQIPINEKALLQNSEGDNVYIGAESVLGEPRVISDKFGSQWKDSIIKTPYYVYGVDTVAKKIWRVTTTSDNPQTISDMHIQQFLNQNITLGERENTPILGIRNVKTHYNAFKQDVMFTFYDNLYGFEEKVWNICWNEITQIWTTLYSWIPSYSENIYNQYFSFDRNTSKWIAKLGISNSKSSFADGITLNNNLIDDLSSDYENISDNNLYRIGKLSISNRNIKPEYLIKYSIERDNFQNYKYFTLEEEESNLGTESRTSLINEKNSKFNVSKDCVLKLKSKLPDNYPYPVILLNIKAKIFKEIEGEKVPLNKTLDAQGYYQNVIAVCLKSVYNRSKQNLSNPDNLKHALSTDFWKHGQAGLQDIAEKIRPTMWYGKQHPFEFEFIVSEYPEVQKIFDNLQIISNNAEPESFHYWIEGDSLQFANDKKNMYIRQESTKELYQYNGSDILYDHKWKELENEGVIQNPRSTILPQIYEARQDTFNEIEDYYQQISAPNKNYDRLTGTEVTYDCVTDQYGLWTHSEAINIDNNTEGNRLRGNIQYRNDTWKVQISPINFVQKNEISWNKVPITIANLPIPSCININNVEIPESLKDKQIDFSSWGSLPMIQNINKKNNTYTYTTGGIDNAATRQEGKIRDKYIKIRVRYKGDKLAIIRKILTIYSTTV